MGWGCSRISGSTPIRPWIRVEAFLRKHLVTEAGEAREANPLEGLLNP